MRLAAVLLGSMLAAHSAGAWAQAIVNPGALDVPAVRLAPKPPAPRAEPRPKTRIAVEPTRPASPAAPTRTAKPVLPIGPPPAAVLPPATVVPVLHPPPPPVIPMAPDAPGTAAMLPTGLRITFGTDRSDLSPATVDALRKYAATLGQTDNTTVTIMAYAAGPPEDPSTPRRLSLGRALAARAVLMESGVASTRIYPRALGPAPDGPPDRVDLIRYPPAIPLAAP